MTHNILNIQVKLGEPGWRDRYYEEKFGARTSERMEEICRDVVSILWDGKQYTFVDRRFHLIVIRYVNSPIFAYLIFDVFLPSLGSQVY